MKTRLHASPSTMLWTSLILIAVLLGACAPASTATNPPATETPVTTILEPSTTPSTLEPTTEPALSGATEGSTTEAVAATPFPVATSRGPELEATDPTTFNLASGQVQFVEFFRFT